MKVPSCEGDADPQPKSAELRANIQKQTDEHVALSFGSQDIFETTEFRNAVLRIVKPVFENPQHVDIHEATVVDIDTIVDIDTCCSPNLLRKDFAMGDRGRCVQTQKAPISLNDVWTLKDSVAAQVMHEFRPWLNSLEEKQAYIKDSLQNLSSQIQGAKPHQQPQHQACQPLDATDPECEPVRLASIKQQEAVVHHQVWPVVREQIEAGVAADVLEAEAQEWQIFQESTWAPGLASPVRQQSSQQGIEAQAMIAAAVEGSFTNGTIQANEAPVNTGGRRQDQDEFRDTDLGTRYRDLNSRLERVEFLLIDDLSSDGLAQKQHSRSVTATAGGQDHSTKSESGFCRGTCEMCDLDVPAKFTVAESSLDDTPMHDVAVHETVPTDAVFDSYETVWDMMYL